MSWYLQSVRTDGLAFADIVRASPLRTPIATCPGWDLRALTEHLGAVHRWARLAAITGRQPEDSAIEAAPQEQGALADWLAEGADALADSLASIPDGAPTWHPFPVPLVARVWPRRQAHETAIHHWDAGSAVGQAPTIDPMRATDFVGEYLSVVVPRVIDRDGRRAPQGELHLVLVDSGVEFGVRVEGTVVDVVDPHALRDPATITGTAEDVLLALWRRRPLVDAPTSGRAADWLAFGGN